MGGAGGPGYQPPAAICKPSVEQSWETAARAAVPAIVPRSNARNEILWMLSFPIGIPLRTLRPRLGASPPSPSPYARYIRDAPQQDELHEPFFLETLLPAGPTWGDLDRTIDGSMLPIVREWTVTNDHAAGCGVPMSPISWCYVAAVTALGAGVNGTRILARGLANLSLLPSVTIIVRSTSNRQSR